MDGTGKHLGKVTLVQTQKGYLSHLVSFLKSVNTIFAGRYQHPAGKQEKNEKFIVNFIPAVSVQLSMRSILNGPLCMFC